MLRWLKPSPNPSPTVSQPFPAETSGIDNATSCHTDAQVLYASNVKHWIFQEYERDRQDASLALSYKKHSQTPLRILRICNTLNRLLEFCVSYSIVSTSIRLYCHLLLHYILHNTSRSTKTTLFTSAYTVICVCRSHLVWCGEQGNTWL